MSPRHRFCRRPVSSLLTLFAAACAVLTLAALLCWWIQAEPVGGSHAGSIACYTDSPVEATNQLEDISDAPPADGNNIFFHETSCASSATPDGDIVLTPRQACAVESAARANPDAAVHVLFTSPVGLRTAAESGNPVVRALLAHYPNVRLRHVNLARYVRGSPLEAWYATGALRRSRWPTSHASDVLRYLTLWKYPGTYLDLDVVVLKSLSELRNCVGAESAGSIGAGVIRLDATPLGRSMARLLVRELKAGFNPSGWGDNGPDVLTRTLKRYCNVKEVKEMTSDRCSGFVVHPPSVFYPVSYDNWKDYFDRGRIGVTMEKVRDSYVTHVWNKVSQKTAVTVGSEEPLSLLAARHCPKVYATCTSVF